MIANINYKGQVSQNVIKNLKFSDWKPRQFIDRNGEYTIIFFKSGKCRIMGCRKPIEMSKLQYKITNITIQSVTVIDTIGKIINLYKIAGKYIILYNKTLYY